MWRRPKWTTLIIIIGLCLLVAHLAGVINTGRPCQQDGGKDLLSLTQRPTQSNPSPPVAQEPPLHVLEHSKNAPPDFILVSEMNDTIHQWPWPETDKVLKICANKSWGDVSAMPEISVIISFHNNENLFSVLHTIHALVKHTPRNILREIILIDDHSIKDEFRQIMELHIAQFIPVTVRLIRSPVNLGLIRARLEGIRASVAPVVVVMDSHVEPQQGWIEPLLYQIQKNRKVLVTPYLDWMQKFGPHWQYRHGACSWKTYFDWTLTFGFQALSPTKQIDREGDLTAPVRCAVTVGTVWAMDKSWFEEVGAFDEGMQLWGGENLDLAVRVWLFGGEVVNIPCSHVAHLESEGGRDYRNSWSDIIHTNYRRFVEVWMDEYKEYVFQHLPDVKLRPPGDLQSRIALKSRAIHNFTWFLNNILPELGIPDRGTLAWGGIQVLSGGRLPLCLDSMYAFIPQVTICNERSIATQGFFWAEDGLLRLPMNVLNTAGRGVVNNEFTSFYNTNQAAVWFHIENGPIIDTQHGLCLEVTQGNTLELTECQSKPEQAWRFSHYSDAYKHMVASKTSRIIPFQKYLQQPALFTKGPIYAERGAFMARKVKLMDHG